MAIGTVKWFNLQKGCGLTSAADLKQAWFAGERRPFAKLPFAFCRCRHPTAAAEKT
jgi:hypothetical protein